MGKTTELTKSEYEKEFQLVDLKRKSNPKDYENYEYVDISAVDKGHEMVKQFYDIKNYEVPNINIGEMMAKVDKKICENDSAPLPKEYAKFSKIKDTGILICGAMISFAYIATVVCLIKNYVKICVLKNVLACVFFTCLIIVFVNIDRFIPKKIYNEYIEFLDKQKTTRQKLYEMREILEKVLVYTNKDNIILKVKVKNLMTEKFYDYNVKLKYLKNFRIIKDKQGLSIQYFNEKEYGVFFDYYQNAIYEFRYYGEENFKEFNELKKKIEEYAIEDELENGNK